MSNVKISITEGNSGVDKYKLNIAELETNTEYTRLAYCTRVDAGTTELGDPFFKFGLADMHGQVIIGRMFNVENVQNKGITANNFANRVVRVIFRVTIFSNRESLIITAIDPVKENILSREEFIGELDGVLECTEKIHDICKSVGKKFSSIEALIVKNNVLEGIEYVSIPNLYLGRKGGAVKFSVKMFNMIQAVFSDSDKLDDIMAVALLSELFMYWKYSCNYEEDVLSLGENINKILNRSDLYVNKVIEKAEMMNDKRLVKICRETKHLMKCYFGYDTPDTFITKSLTSIRKSLWDSIVLECIHDSMISGTTRSLEQEDGSYCKLVKI